MDVFETGYPSADGITQTRVKITEPEGEPKAVLQVVHGVKEHADKYDDFAACLADRGFVVAVNDLLGHGKSVCDPGNYGYFARNGNAVLIEDISSMSDLLGDRYPSLPRYIMGYSMGSFLVRQFIAEPGRAGDAAGAVLVGTTWKRGWKLLFGRAVCKFLGFFLRDRHRSPFVGRLALGKVTGKQERERLKETGYTLNAFYNLFLSISKSQDVSFYGNIPEDLPLLFLSGSEDALSGKGEGVRKTYMKYRDALDGTVDIKIYEGMGHSILFEAGKDEVTEDIATWLEEALDERKKK